MKFTITGKIWGSKTKITWEDGKLFGDDQRVVRFIHELATKYYEGFPIKLVPGVPATVTDHIKNPLSVYWLIKKYFDEILDYSGDPLYKWYAPNGLDPNALY